MYLATGRFDFGSAESAECCVYFLRLNSRHLFVPNSWYCRIQTTRLIMFFTKEKIYDWGLLVVNCGKYYIYNRPFYSLISKSSVHVHCLSVRNYETTWRGALNSCWRCRPARRGGPPPHPQPRSQPWR